MKFALFLVWDGLISSPQPWENRILKCVCVSSSRWGQTPGPLREPWLGHSQGRAVTAGSIVRQLSLKVFHYVELRSVPFNFYPQILVLLSGETQT